MAGSPRYIELLAEAATMAEDISLDTEDAWSLFDITWRELTNPDKIADPADLMAHSAAALHLQSLLTGKTHAAIAAEGTALHLAKNAGYAGIDNPDPWANFRMATLFNATPAQGALIRLSDKYIRTVNLRANPENEQVGEAITETLRDSVAYPLIILCLIEENEAKVAA